MFIKNLIRNGCKITFKNGEIAYVLNNFVYKPGDCWKLEQFHNLNYWNGHTMRFDGIRDYDIVKIEYENRLLWQKGEEQ